MNKPVLPMSSLSLKLPKADRSVETYRLAASRTFPSKLEGTLNRVAFSAAHVVADPLADVDPWLSAAIDWDRTIAFREHIWDLGLGVAESMDTAQRGMGLDWPTSLELIQRSVAAAKARGNALVFSGAGTDHLAPEDAKSIDDVIRAYEEQIAAVEKAGGRIILMVSRALARIGRSADDYAKVYNRVLGQVREPVIIHWLGDMFDPALANYWGTQNLDTAMDIAVGIINANVAKVDGVKVSLLDKQREIDMRRRLDKNVRMYTGDDFNYAELSAGGVLRAVAPFGRRRAGLSRRAGADGAAVAPCLQGADAVLQDRHRVHGVSQRPSGSFHHGRRPGERALDPAPRRTVPARRQGRPAFQSRTCDATHEDGAGDARRRGLMRDFSADHRWLSLNTATVRKQGDLVQIVNACARHGIRAIDPWRDQVAAIGLDRAVRIVRDAGLDLSGYCRGGMFTSDAAHRGEVRDDNRRAVDEAKALDAPCIVLVAGGLPQYSRPGSAASKDIAAARTQVDDALAEMLEYAKQAGMPLAIEPLHPAYAADRACVNTTKQALDICDRLDPERSGALGVALDVYHIWWDPELMPQIARAGKERLLAFHVCDWLVPTKDILNDRGMMGDGVIDIKSVRAAVEAQGFAGYSEIEIFSNDWWAKPMDEVLRTCIERHQTVV